MAGLGIQFRVGWPVFGALAAVAHTYGAAVPTPELTRSNFIIANALVKERRLQVAHEHAEAVLFRPGGNSGANESQFPYKYLLEEVASVGG